MMSVLVVVVMDVKPLVAAIVVLVHALVVVMALIGVSD
jgi:hypothetical protein